MIDYRTVTDFQLLDSVQMGDEAAFTEIYNRYWDKLFAIAGHKLDHLEDAEEVVQSIFVSLWKRRKVLNVTGSLSAYLAVAVKYRVIKILDKQYHQRKYADNLDIHDLIDDSTQQWLAFNELKTRLGKLVADLPEKCQLIYRMSREDGASQKEIAVKLGVSEKTVEAHLGKAIKKIRSGLDLFLMTLL